MSIGESRLVARRGWHVLLSIAVLGVLVAVVTLAPLVLVEVQAGAVRSISDSAALYVMDDDWSRDLYTLTETTEEVVVERKMAVWDVITGPPEAILPIMRLQKKPLSAPLDDRAVIDAATGEPVSLHHP